MISLTSFFIALYLAIGVGHAFTLYQCGKALDEINDNPKLVGVFAIDAPAAMFAVLIWPLFVFGMFMDKD